MVELDATVDAHPRRAMLGRHRRHRQAHGLVAQFVSEPAHEAERHGGGAHHGGHGERRDLTPKLWKHRRSIIEVHALSEGDEAAARARPHAAVEPDEAVSLRVFAVERHRNGLDIERRCDRLLENALPHTLKCMAEVERGRREEGLHAWAPGEGRTWQVVDWCDPHDGSLLVADSWRVVDGAVRGLERHGARFLAGVSAQRPTEVETAERFVDDAIAALPREGDWFPRLELRTRGTGVQWWLRLRPTPPTSTEVVVATAPRDGRTQPLVKGPDLDALLSLRTAVQPLGAGEAVILDADGHIVEGAYSGLLWWHDGVLVRPADTLPRIASVTVDLVLAAARAEGVALDERRARPDELDGCELWVLSALHGLRVATAWIDGPTLAPDDRAARARAWLAAAARAVAE